MMMTMSETVLAAHTQPVLVDLNCTEATSIYMGSASRCMRMRCC